MSKVSAVSAHATRKTTTAEGIEALRDFFFAKDGQDVRIAAENIAQRFNMPLSGDIDWVEVEYEYNRLFVGPAAVPAPPYASAYLTEPQLMGKPSLEVRDLYRQLNLGVPDEGATPDDHLSFEIDAVIVMEALAQQVVPDEAEALADMRAWLIGDHMADWIPKFTQAVRAQEPVSEPIRVAVDALQGWIETAEKC